MALLLDSFWRAVAYCIRPRVIALSFLPLLIMVGVALGLGYFFWDGALQAVRDWLESARVNGQPWAKSPPPPRLPADVVANTAAKYREARERLTG